MDKNYSNEELGRCYFVVTSIYAGSAISLLGLKNVRRVISEAEINLADFYREHGSLADLECKGIGSRIKAILELILERGVDAAKKEFAEKKVRPLHTPSLGKSKRKSTTDEASPSWDDVIRSLDSI